MTCCYLPYVNFHRDCSVLRTQDVTQSSCATFFQSPQSSAFAAAAPTLYATQTLNPEQPLYIPERDGWRSLVCNFLQVLTSMPRRPPAPLAAIPSFIHHHLACTHRSTCPRGSIRSAPGSRSCTDMSICRSCDLTRHPSAFKRRPMATATESAAMISKQITRITHSHAITCRAQLKPRHPRGCFANKVRQAGA